MKISKLLLSLTCLSGTVNALTVTISGADVDNNASFASGYSAVLMQNGTLTNTGTVIDGGGTFDMTGGTVVNSGAAANISSSGIFSLGGGSLNNGTLANIASSGTFTMTSGNLTNSAIIGQSGVVSITGGNLTIQNGSRIGGSASSVTISIPITNVGGAEIATGATNFSLSANLTNTGSVAAGASSATISNATIISNGGDIGVGATINFGTVTVTSNTGNIGNSGNLTINNSNITNDAGGVIGNTSTVNFGTVTMTNSASLGSSATITVNNSTITNQSATGNFGSNAPSVSITGGTIVNDSSAIFLQNVTSATITGVNSFTNAANSNVAQGGSNLTIDSTNITNSGNFGAGLATLNINNGATVTNTSVLGTVTNFTLGTSTLLNNAGTTVATNFTQINSTVTNNAFMQVSNATLSSGAFTGSGQLNVSGGTLTNNIAITQGTLTVDAVSTLNASSTINANVSSLAPSSIINTYGNIFIQNLNSSGTLTIGPSNAIDTLNVGTATLNPTGTVYINVDLAAGTSDKMLGAASNIGVDGALQVNYLNSTSGISTYTIIDTAGGTLTGSFSTLTNMSLVGNATLTYSGTSVILTVNSVNSGENVWTNAASTGQWQEAGNWLSGSIPDLTSVAKFNNTGATSGTIENTAPGNAQKMVFGPGITSFIFNGSVINLNGSTGGTVISGTGTSVTFNTPLNLMLAFPYAIDTGFNTVTIGDLTGPQNANTGLTLAGTSSYIINGTFGEGFGSLTLNDITLTTSGTVGQSVALITLLNSTFTNTGNFGATATTIQAGAITNDSPGNFGAGATNVTAGAIDNKAGATFGGVTIGAASINNSGNFGVGSSGITASGAIINNSVGTFGGVTIGAASINNSGNFGVGSSGITASGAIINNSGGTFGGASIQANAITNSGNFGQSATSINAITSILNQNGGVLGGSCTIAAGSITNNSGGTINCIDIVTNNGDLTNAGDLGLSANNISAIGFSIINSANMGGSTTTIQAGTIQNNLGTLNGSVINTQVGSLMNSGTCGADAFNISSALDIDNQGGTLGGTNAIINAEGITNANGATIVGTEIHSTADVLNAGNYGSNAVNISVTGGSITNNSPGSFGGASTIISAEDIYNNSTFGGGTITAANITNNGSLGLSASEITATARIDNQTGTLGGNNTVISADGILNADTINGTSIASSNGVTNTGDFGVSAATINVSNGVLNNNAGSFGGNSTNIIAQAVSNASGATFGGGTIQAVSISNGGSFGLGASSIDVTNAITNSGGTVGQASTNISASSISNEATLNGNQITASGLINNGTSATLVGGVIQANAITNNGTFGQSATSISAIASITNNAAGVLGQTTSAISTANIINQGTLLGNNIIATTLNNSGPCGVGAGVVNIGSVTNTNVFATNKTTVTISNYLSNSGTACQGVANLNLNNASVTNNTNAKLAGGATTVTISGADILNDTGATFGDGATTITLTTGTVNNSGSFGNNATLNLAGGKFINNNTLGALSKTSAAKVMSTQLPTIAALNTVAKTALNIKAITPTVDSSMFFGQVYETSVYLNGLLASNNATQAIKDIYEQVAKMNVESQESALFDLAPQFKVTQFAEEKLDLLLHKELEGVLYSEFDGLRGFVLAGYDNFNQNKKRGYAGYNVDNYYQLIGLTQKSGSVKWLESIGVSESYMKLSPNQSKASYTTAWGSLGVSSNYKRWIYGLDALFGYNFVKTNRHVSFLNEIAHSSHGQWSASLDAKVGYKISNDKHDIMFYENLGYLYGSENSYTETGAIGNNYSVKNEDVSVIRNQVGVRVDYKTKHNWQAFADAAWVYDYYTNDNTYQAAIIPTGIYSSFNQIIPTQNLARINVGLEGTHNRFDWKIAYTGLYGKNIQDSAGSVRFGYKF